MIKILKDHFWLYVIWRIACRLFWIVTFPIWFPLVLILLCVQAVIEGVQRWIANLKWEWWRENNG